MIEIVTIIVLLILIPTVLFFSERKTRVELRECFIKYIKEQQAKENEKQNEQIVPKLVHASQLKPEYIVTVARWVCANCDNTYTLNYNRIWYNQINNGLDITGSYKTYECSRCGNNLMRICFIQIPYGDTPKPWQNKTP